VELTFAEGAVHNQCDVRRLPAIILFLAFLGLGSGLLESLHMATHLREHAASKATHSNQPERSESDCALCIQLHVPALSSGWVPLLVCLGLLVAFLSLLTSLPPLQHFLPRIDCRGPPLL
jgi:hypothetical protein